MARGEWVRIKIDVLNRLIDDATNSTHHVQAEEIKELRFAVELSRHRATHKITEKEKSVRKTSPW